MFNQFPIKSNSIRAGFGSVQNFGSLNMARSIQTNMAMPFMYTPHTTLDQLGNQYGMEGFYPFPSGNSMMNMNMNMNPMMMGGCYQQPSKFEKGLMTFFGIASIATAVGGLLSILLGHKKANQAQENLDIVSGWIAAQSGTKILYDLLFGFIAMVIARFTKKILWIAIG